MVSLFLPAAAVEAARTARILAGANGLSRAGLPRAVHGPALPPGS
jgi:hypothetical protein